MAAGRGEGAREDERDEMWVDRWGKEEGLGRSQLVLFNRATYIHRGEKKQSNDQCVVYHALLSLCWFFGFELFLFSSLDFRMSLLLAGLQTRQTAWFCGVTKKKGVKHTYRAHPPKSGAGRLDPSRLFLFQSNLNSPPTSKCVGRVRVYVAWMGEVAPLLLLSHTAESDRSIEWKPINYTTNPP